MANNNRSSSLRQKVSRVCEGKQYLGRHLFGLLTICCEHCRTGEFLACTGHDINLQLAEDLVDSVSVDTRTNVALTRLDGSLVAVSSFNHSSRTDNFKLVDSGFIDQQTYDQLTSNPFWVQDVWDAAAVQKIVKNNVVHSSNRIIACVPVPLPPEEFERGYMPDFFLFVVANVDDVFGLVDQIETAIEGEVADLLLNSILIGLGGLLIFLGTVAFVSHILTRPLRWMETTAWKIVNHADKRVSEELVVPHAQHEEDDPLVGCSPKTEIRELVTEFQTMIRGFSGTGASRVAPSKMDEVKNFVTWKEDFRQFYQLNQTMEDRIKEEMSQKAQSYGRRISMGKRSKGNSSYGPTASEIIANISEASQVSEEESVTFRSAEMRKEPGSQRRFGRTDSSTMFKRPLTRTNLGTNLPLHGSYARMNEMEENIRISRSALFRWALCSMVLPLVLTNIVIASLVADNLLNSFPGSVQKAEKFSFDLGSNFLRDVGKLHALYGDQVLLGSMRDLHMLTRIAGWLLLGAVPRSDSFSQLELSMVEECRAYTLSEVCPFDVDPALSPCNCAWHDPWGRKCDEFSVRTRPLQRMWFVCQARDYDPITGDRYASLSFPEFAFNPMSTKWWTDADTMPGAEQGANASGYETSYDRLRVISALETVSIPLYNYFNIAGYRGSRTAFSSYFAFDADGGYLGYAGCNYDASRCAQFKSSQENGAYLVNPELCPVGKYGYDPRCRIWYSETKRQAVWQDGFVYATAPYKFAATEVIGTTAGSGIIDPKTNGYVGTAAIDLSPTEIFSALEKTDVDFYFVISPVGGDDSIVGPGHPLNSPPENIAQVVLPYDGEGSKNWRVFSNITAKMKAGEAGLEEFYRKSLDGQNSELVLSFAPVRARVLKATRPDDFTRGAEMSHVLWYSIGVVKSRDTLAMPFQGVKKEIESSVEATAIIFVSSVAAITFLCILATAKVIHCAIKCFDLSVLTFSLPQISIAVTKPMLILLRVVQRVNAGRIEDNMPPLEGGSREVTQVYMSFAKLYKIVRMSNSSFFSGDFKLAHHIASDALKLFRKIGDEKAIAIACNNIGNTLLALSIQRREKGICMKTDGICRVDEALRHFDETIEIGTTEFESSDSDVKKADLAQQLADRHFNRAICLLHCTDDSCCPTNSKEMAFVDLYRCREYDRGVQEFMLHEKLMFKYSDVVFERLLRRIHGLSLLFTIDPTVWQVWDVNDLVEQADIMLQAAWDQEKAPLFYDVVRVGRLQQLEGAVVGLELTSGKLEEASQLAMRMLVEDEYIIDSSFVVAADTILRLMREPNLSWSREAKLRTSLEFRRMRRAGKRTALDIERCFVFCIELGEKLEHSPELAKINAEVMSFYEEQCNDKDTVGLVALNDTTDSNLVIKLSPKEKIDSEQREALETATQKVGGSLSNAALPTAVNMAVSPSRSRTSDVFLIFISDGSLWDARSFAAIHKKVREASGKRTASINVISIGINIEDDSFADNCRNLCLATRSRNSYYLPATNDTISETFESAADLISSSSSSECSRIQLGVTMERF